MHSIKRIQSFKFELRPNGLQERQMRQFAEACRYVYNRALALEKERRKRGEPRLGYVELCKLLTKWRNEEETAWLREAPAQPLQQAIKDLDMAYANFFAKRSGFPRFRKNGRQYGFRYPDPKGIKLDQTNDRIFLPKLGWVRYRNSREVLGTVRNVTVKQHCEKWYVSIQTERDVELPISRDGVVGIDMGVARFATLSDGTFYAPLNSFRRHEASLRKAQQALSRKVKFSKNWKKALSRVQRIQARIANARRDFLHKCSTEISKNHAVVFVEGLQVRNMTQSASGTKESPGKNVRAKSALNKSILDQGWAEFRRQLEYKLAWNGGRLIAVPPQNTSRTCPSCGHVSAENRQSQELFRCVKCGFEHNADVVGALNILSRGMKMLRDEGRGTSDASLGMPTECFAGVSPDGLWIEPRWRSEAGTHRSDSSVGSTPTPSAVGISGIKAGEDAKRSIRHTCCCCAEVIKQSQSQGERFVNQPTDKTKALHTGEIIWRKLISLILYDNEEGNIEGYSKRI